MTTKTRVKHRKLTRLERQERNQEALERGTRFKPCSTDMAVIVAFVERGLPHDQIHTFGPEQNIRTFAAWQALGRCVRKGEESVRSHTWRPIDGKKDPNNPGKLPKQSLAPVTCCLFHISQTEKVGA